MKFGSHADAELDDIDLRILAALQEDCRTPLTRLGERVGLSAPSVLERIKKLEAARVVTGYHAALDARRLGLDVTAFIGVLASSADLIARFEECITAMDEVLECHHVTGEFTLLLKVKTADTSSLERLISRIRALDGVSRTDTSVVLSTLAERAQILLPAATEAATPPMPKRQKRNGERNQLLRGA
ncbi:MAG: Lrp/AsnC family transcriptional regulator [bacterium]|nr:Lrp/AsnC family transcriptional regulator [bacterium]